MYAYTKNETRNRGAVSERALLARLNRALKKDWRVIKVVRPGTRTYQALGRYYVLNTYQNVIEDWRISLEEVARERNLLAPWEHLAIEAEARP